MISAPELAGWAAAALAAGAALWSEWRRACALERVVRAAHELRGPITAVRLGLHAGAGEGELSAVRLRALEHELERATLALADLAGAGSAQRREQLDLGVIVAECTEALRAAAAEQGATLQLRWPHGTALVLGDRLRLAQALANLVANAIEHGGGLIELCGRVDQQAVRVEVTDDGPGLPAPVATLAARARRGRGSRGRGLAIASKVAREHGGRLAAAPSDRGARIVLELPLAAGASLSAHRPGA